MKLQEIYNKIDTIYPKRLSDEFVAEYGGHDNSGILVDIGENIHGAVFSLDLSVGAIERAKASGKNLIVTHHPAIFYPIASLRHDDPVGARILSAVRNGISVISMHLNCDCAKGGIDENLAKALGADNMHIVNPIENCGYGRIFDIGSVNFYTFVENVKKELATDRAFFYGTDEKIERVASFCGSGVDGAAIAAASKAGAQVIVSADIKHNCIYEAIESGLRVVQLTHYASENYGFKKIYQNLKDKIGIESEYHDDLFML